MKAQTLVVNVVAVVLLAHSSFAYDYSSLIRNQVEEIRELTLNSQNDLTSYRELLKEFLKDLKNHISHDSKEKSTSLKDYQKNLRKLLHLANETLSKNTLFKNRLAKEMFVKKFQNQSEEDDEDHGLWTDITNFITSPWGAFLTLTITAGAIWYFWDHIKNFLNFSGTKISPTAGSSPESEYNEEGYISDPYHHFSPSNDNKWSVKYIEHLIKNKYIQTINHTVDSNGLSAIKWATMNDNPDLVKKILQFKRVNRNNPDGMWDHRYYTRPGIADSALILACIYGKNTIALELLKDENKGLVDVGHVRSFGVNYRTPLMMAAEYGNTFLLKTLLNHKDMNRYYFLRKGKFSESAYFYAASKNLETFKLLFESKHARPDDINLTTDSNYGSIGLLHKAAHSNKVRVVKYLLNNKKFKIGPNLASKESGTPLSIAVSLGHDEIVQELLKYPMPDKTLHHKQIDLNMTLLYLASDKNHEKVVKLLLADKDFKKTINFSENFKKNIPLHAAALTQKEPKTLKLLLSHPKSKDGIKMQNNDGDTPFHYAARSERQKNIELFLKSPFMTKEIFNIKNKEGLTAYEWFRKNGSNANAFIPLHHYFKKMTIGEKGWSVDIVNQGLKNKNPFLFKNKDKLQYTSLIWATLAEEKDIVEKLVISNLATASFLNAKDYSGMTALDWAKQYGFISIRKILERKR